jgi:hypothetical protein
LSIIPNIKAQEVAAVSKNRAAQLWGESQKYKDPQGISLREEHCFQNEAYAMLVSDYLDPWDLRYMLIEVDAHSGFLDILESHKEEHNHEEKDLCLTCHLQSFAQAYWGPGNAALTEGRGAL